MARGFYTTFGSDATDAVTTTLTSKPITRSYHIWANRNGAGGASNGRLFQAANDYSLGYYGSGDQVVYQRKWSGTDGIWNTNTALFSTGTWLSIGISYDGNADTQDPIIYVNGSSQAIAELSAPTGTLGTTTGAYTVGNDPAGSRNWDGMLAEFAVWDVILTAAEFAALAKGYSPLLIRPASLEEYVPMVRDNVSLKRGAPTISGTAVQPHPRVIGPRKRYSAIQAPPPPPETLFAQACL